MSSEEKIHGSIYYVIPAQVFEDKDLEDSEKMFYGLLSGLAFSNGFCFASDAYLAKRKGVDERTISRWLEKLEKKGYVRRDTKKNGMFWDRKIFIMHSHVNSNKSYERAPKSPSNGRTCQDRTDPHVDIESEVPSACESMRENPPPPSSKKEPKPATPEEEEEISKRLRERPKELPKIKCKKAWKRVVLEEIRSEGENIKENLEKIIERRTLAISKDMLKNSDGELICAYTDYVEFSYGSKVRSVRYDVSQEEWTKQTRWN